MTVQEGDVIEICSDRYGEIGAFIIEEIKTTHRDTEIEASIRNSKYLLVRKINDDDELKESTNKQGHIVWRVK